MTAKKKGPAPQLRRWLKNYEREWQDYQAKRKEWESAWDPERGPEPTTPLFVQTVVQPLAEFINRHAFYGKGKVEVWGPQGICARYSIMITYRGRDYYLGVEFEDTEILLTIRRYDLPKKGEFGKNTIGEINGMDYPTTPVTKCYPAEWWRKRMMSSKTR